MKSPSVIPRMCMSIRTVVAANAHSYTVSWSIIFWSVYKKYRNDESKCNTGSSSIGDWQVDAATDMAGMFYGAIAFNQYIGGWQVGAVANMQFIFYGAVAFNQDIGGWQ